MRVREREREREREKTERELKRERARASERAIECFPFPKRVPQGVWGTGNTRLEGGESVCGRERKGLEEKEGNDEQVVGHRVSPQVVGHRVLLSPQEDNDEQVVGHRLLYRHSSQLIQNSKP